MNISGISKVPSNRKINEDILFRNCELFRKYRDEHFRNARNGIYDVLNRFKDKKLEDSEIEELIDMISVIFWELENSRFYGRMSVGGNNISPPPSVSQAERAWVDQIETIYSYSRTTQRFLRHSARLTEYMEKRGNIEDEITEYVLKIKQSDTQIVFRNLEDMIERIEIYSRYLGNMPGNGRR